MTLTHIPPRHVRRALSSLATLGVAAAWTLGAIGPAHGGASAEAAPAPSTTVTAATTVAAATAPTTTIATGTTGAATTATSVPAATTAAVAGPLGGSAAATKPARRLRQSGTMMFPMDPVPRCAILDNFGDPRGNGSRSHEGTDILATSGQAIYAVDGGVLTKQYVAGGPNSSLSGNAWTLTMPDKTYVFYAHLSSFAPGLVVGSTVQRGDVIGYVGDTGDAGPGNNHLHFEWHPLGGAAVNVLPKLEVPTACTIT